MGDSHAYHFVPTTVTLVRWWVCDLNHFPYVTRYNKTVNAENSIKWRTRFYSQVSPAWFVNTTKPSCTQKATHEVPVVLAMSCNTEGTHNRDRVIQDGELKES